MAAPWRRCGVDFKLLKLNKEGDKLFESPVISTWVSYVKKMDTENPYTSMLSTLKLRYSDENLASMLVAAKKTGSTRLIAENVETAQFKMWRSDGKTADDLFTLLRLDKEGEALFKSTMFNTWASYAKLLDKENPEKLMVSAMKTHYSDGNLASIIAAARENSRTEAVASRLQQELWLSQDKTSKDIFKLLKLDKDGQRFIENPQLGTWVSYCSKLAKTRGDFRAISMLEKSLEAKSWR